MTLIRYSVAVKVSLVFVWRINFCSAAGNFWERTLYLRSFFFLVTVVMALSDPLDAVTATQLLGSELVVVGAGAGLPCSWVVACCWYPWVCPLDTGGFRGIYSVLGWGDR